MLNEMLKDEELSKIVFAEILNQNGVNTGVNTEKLFKKYFEEDNMKDIPMSIKELEETKKLKNEYRERLTEPDYYAQDGLSPIGAMKQGLTSQEELIGFYKGNIIKYVVRAGKKGNAVKDLLKARNYINFYLDLFTMTPEEMEEFHQAYKTPINKNDVAADKSELLKNERCILEPVSKDVEIKLPEADLTLNGTLEDVKFGENIMKAFKDIKEQQDD